MDQLHRSNTNAYVHGTRDTSKNLPGHPDLGVVQNDYPAWVVEAGRQLRRQNLLDVVEGTESVPDPMARDYQKKSDKALDYLIDAVGQETSFNIRGGCETAHEAWKILKDTFEAQTRTHMTALLLNLVTLRFDHRKGSSLNDHINEFEGHWLKLAQAAAAGSSTKGSMAADIKTFSQSDAWKASLLLATFPRIQPYINIVQNITASEDKPTYANVIIRLRDITTAKSKTCSKIPSGWDSGPNTFFYDTCDPNPHKAEGSRVRPHPRNSNTKHAGISGVKLTNTEGGRSGQESEPESPLPPSTINVDEIFVLELDHQERSPSESDPGTDPYILSGWLPRKAMKNADPPMDW